MGTKVKCQQPREMRSAECQFMTESHFRPMLGREIRTQRVDKRLEDKAERASLGSWLARKQRDRAEA